MGNKSKEEFEYASLIVVFDEELSKRGGNFYRIELVLPEGSQTVLKKNNGGMILPKTLKIKDFMFIGQNDEVTPINKEDLEAIKMRLLLDKKMSDFVVGLLSKIETLEKTTVDGLNKIKEDKAIIQTFLGMSSEVEQEAEKKKVARKSKKND